MAQHDYVIDDASGAAVLSDLNAVLSAVRTNNSGATEPAAKWAYMLWSDTTAGVLKMRNSANNAWIVLFELGKAYPAFPAGTVTYFYQAAAPTGWTIKDTVTDKVLSVKGGGQAYNVAGGNTAGTWTVAGITVDSHTHTISNHVHTTSHSHTITHTHDLPISAQTNALYTINAATGSSRTFTHHNGTGQTDEADVAKDSLITYGTNTASSGTDATNTGNPTTNPASAAASANTTTSAGTWRPAAAVGILATKD